MKVVKQVDVFKMSLEKKENGCIDTLSKGHLIYCSKT